MQYNIRQLQNDYRNLYTLLQIKKVTKFLSLGSSSFVDIIDKVTILKYSKTSGDKITLVILYLKA